MTGRVIEGSGKVSHVFGVVACVEHCTATSTAVD